MEVFVQFFNEPYDVSITLDIKTMQAASISPEIAITGAGKNIPLKDELDKILDPIGLGWVITPTGIVITTREVAAEKKAAVKRLKKSLPNLKDARIIVEWP